MKIISIHSVGNWKRTKMYREYLENCNYKQFVSPILASAIGLILFYRVYKYMFYKPPNFPPGPPRIPRFGSYLFLLLLNYSHIHKAISVLSKFYKTNVLGLYLGDTLTVVVNDTKSVKELLLNASFDGRPDIEITKVRDPNREPRGIFFLDGPAWKQQRRFALRHLRDFGFGRRFSSFEIEINDELQILIDMLKFGPKFPHERKIIKNGKALCPYIFSIGPVNLLLYLMRNERYPRSEFNKLLDIAKDTFVFQRVGDSWGRMYSIFPSLAKICPDFCGYTDYKNACMQMNAFISGVIDEQIKTYNGTCERNFLDIYIKDLKEAESTGEESYFTYNQLLMTCVDFFFPAISAIAAQITMYMQLMILKPEIQRKVQDEIDRVVGCGRLPTLDDRINLPYTESSVREILRHQTLATNSIGHKALEDTKLLGYDIPKGCVAVTALHESHFDKKTFDDPEEFRPERFLDENGKFSIKKDLSTPFGAGKRLCAGETYARNILFIFIAGVLQNFNIRTPKHHRPIDLSENVTGFIKAPPDSWIQFEPR